PCANCCTSFYWTSTRNAGMKGLRTFQHDGGKQGAKTDLHRPFTTMLTRYRFCYVLVRNGHSRVRGLRGRPCSTTAMTYLVCVCGCRMSVCASVTILKTWG